MNFISNNNIYNPKAPKFIMKKRLLGFFASAVFLFNLNSFSSAESTKDACNLKDKNCKTNEEQKTNPKNKQLEQFKIFVKKGAGLLRFFILIN